MPVKRQIAFKGIRRSSFAPEAPACRFELERGGRKLFDVENVRAVHGFCDLLTSGLGDGAFEIDLFASLIGVCGKTGRVEYDFTADFSGGIALRVDRARFDISFDAVCVSESLFTHVDIHTTFFQVDLTGLEGGLSCWLAGWFASSLFHWFRLIARRLSGDIAGDYHSDASNEQRPFRNLHASCHLVRPFRGISIVRHQWLAAGMRRDGHCGMYQIGCTYSLRVAVG